MEIKEIRLKVFIKTIAKIFWIFSTKEVKMILLLGSDKYTHVHLYTYVRLMVRIYQRCDIMINMYRNKEKKSEKEKEKIRKSSL